MKSRRTRAVVAGSLALVVVAAGMWAWFLSGLQVSAANEWSGILQGFAAFLTIPALIIGVLAMKPGESNQAPSGSDSRGRLQWVKIGKIKARGKVDVDVSQKQ